MFVIVFVGVLAVRGIDAGQRVDNHLGRVLHVLIVVVARDHRRERHAVGPIDRDGALTLEGLEQLDRARRERREQNAPVGRLVRCELNPGRLGHDLDATRNLHDRFFVRHGPRVPGTPTL